MHHLTKDEIQVASSVLFVLEREGATFTPSTNPSSELSAKEAAQELVSIDVRYETTTVVFRQRQYASTVTFSNWQLAQDPFESIKLAMDVRSLFVDFFTKISN